MIFEFDSKRCLDHASEEVPGEHHARDPERSADDAERQKFYVRHFSSSDNERSKRADDRYEPREDDGLHAVLFKEVFCFCDTARLKDERAFAIEKRLAHHASGPVAGTVTDHRAEKK